MTRTAAFLIAAFAFVGSAHSATFIEQEPNDTLATAQLLVHDGSIDLVGAREFSQTGAFNDFYRFDATAGDQVTLRLAALAGGDPWLALLDANGAFLAQNDDADGSLNSRISFTATTTGIYYAAMRGFSNSVYDYRFTAAGLTPTAAVPEPATWAMMIGGFGLAGVAMRRRATAKVSFA